PGAAARPSREDDLPRPLTAYGRTKLAAENFIRSDASVPWTILRPSAIYGPRDRQLLPLFRAASHGLFWLAARPDTAFTLIDVEDAARAVVMAAENPNAIGGTFFVGHPEPQTASAILGQIAHVVGRTYRPIRVPFVVLRG